MKRWFVLLIPAILLGSLISWRIEQKKAEVAEQGKMREMRMKAPAVVAVAAAEVKDIVQTFEATGTVESPQNVKIASKVTGRVESLPFYEGDRVKKGQVLVRIDPSEVQAQVLQAQANLAEARYRLAQAQLNQTPADVSVNTQIRQQRASLQSSTADYNQTVEGNKAEVAAAEAAITEAEGRVESAKAAVSNAKASVSSAAANLENARTRHNRITELYKQGYVAAQDVDDAKAALSVHEANVQTAKGQLESANALLNAAVAQKTSAEQKAKVTKAKGQADIEASRARMVQSQASFDYANANSVQKGAYRQSLAALQSSVDAAKASLRAAQAKMSDTVLVSPLDGFVTGRFADVGSIASAGQPVMSVQFIKQVWVTIGVPEEVSAKLHIGQPAKITFDALGGREFTANVIQINPSADLQSRQYTVRVILSNKEGLFKPGMFARVSIATDTVKGAVAVPREAVKRDRTGSFVVLVDESGKAKQVPVTTGASDPSLVAIESGVMPGDKVVTLSAGPVRDGQAVKFGGRGKERRQAR